MNFATVLLACVSCLIGVFQQVWLDTLVFSLSCFDIPALSPITDTFFQITGSITRLALDAAPLQEIDSFPTTYFSNGIFGDGFTNTSLLSHPGQNTTLLLVRVSAPVKVSRYTIPPLSALDFGQTPSWQPNSLSIVFIVFLIAPLALILSLFVSNVFSSISRNEAQDTCTALRPTSSTLELLPPLRNLDNDRQTPQGVRLDGRMAQALCELRRHDATRVQNVSYDALACMPGLRHSANFRSVSIPLAFTPPALPFSDLLGYSGSTASHTWTKCWAFGVPPSIWVASILGDNQQPRPARKTAVIDTTPVEDVPAVFPDLDAWVFPIDLLQLGKSPFIAPSVRRSRAFGRRHYRWTARAVDDEENDAYLRAALNIRDVDAPRDGPLSVIASNSDIDAWTFPTNLSQLDNDLQAPAPTRTRRPFGFRRDPASHAIAEDDDEADEYLRRALNIRANDPPSAADLPMRDDQPTSPRPSLDEWVYPIGPHQIDEVFDVELPLYRKYIFGTLRARFKRYVIPDDDSECDEYLRAALNIPDVNTPPIEGYVPEEEPGTRPHWLDVARWVLPGRPQDDDDPFADGPAQPNRVLKPPRTLVQRYLASRRADYEYRLFTLGIPDTSTVPREIDYSFNTTPDWTGLSAWGREASELQAQDSNSAAPAILDIPHPSKAAPYIGRVLAEALAYRAFVFEIPDGRLTAVDHQYDKTPTFFSPNATRSEDSHTEIEVDAPLSAALEERPPLLIHDLPLDEREYRSFALGIPLQRYAFTASLRYESSVRDIPNRRSPAVRRFSGRREERDPFVDSAVAVGEG
ncbi:hypothetical protein C8Q78DRAFT_1062538 [Trametes maxima]|nr:hypothetical protein C8Q78DRAFT_1062538 [Trametes maxima]